jgi:hypothetical protein
MPLPVVPQNIGNLDPDALVAAYERLATLALTRLGARLAANQNSTAPVANLAALLNGHQTTTNVWQGLAAALTPLRGQPNFRVQLSLAVQRVNTLEQNVNAAIPPAGPVPAAPLGVAGLGQLTAAVTLAATLPGLLAGNAGANAISGLFGPQNVDAVRARVAAINTALARVLQDTDPNATGAARGFVPYPALPTTMAALAMGSGPSAYIRVSPGSLAVLPAADLAAVLVHEGSHILAAGATVDFAYRERGSLYLLTPDLAVDNAPHYEQLARNQLTAPVPVPAPTGSTTDLAGALLRSKVTRAWVRAYDLQDMSDTGRADVGNLIGARTAAIGDALAGAMFADLVTSVENVLDVAQSVLTIQEGAPTGINVAPGAVTVTVSPGQTPLTDARVGIGLMCQYLEDHQGTALDMAALTTYIDHIEQYDRPALRARLAAFYDKYGSGLTQH